MAAGKDQREWYVPDRDSMEAVGPIATADLLKRIKNGQLRIDEYVWGSHFTDDQWKRIADLEELRTHLADYPKLPPPPAMRGRRAGKVEEAPKFDYQAPGEYGSENVYRRFPRVPIEAEVIIRNNLTYHRTNAVDVSEKGIQLTLPASVNTSFNKGDEVVITVRNAPGIGTFSAPAVIMRVLTENGLHGFGLFFLRLNPLARRRISKFVIEQLKSGQAVAFSPGPAPGKGAAA